MPEFMPGKASDGETDTSLISNSRSKNIRISQTDTSSPSFSDSKSKIPKFVWLILAIIIIILFCVAIGLIAFYLAPNNAVSCSDEIDHSEYRDQYVPLSKEEALLPSAFVPRHYELKIKPMLELKNASNLQFQGWVTIDILCNQSSNTIVLNAKPKIAFTKDSVSLILVGQTIGFQPESINFHNRNEKVDIVFDQTFQRGANLRLYVNYTGEVSANLLKGMYLSSYSYNGERTKYLIATQFEVAEARQAFPCFDEPRFKANFTISIIRRNNMKSLSNMPRKSYTSIGNGWTQDDFMTSVKMSTYLVGWIICDFPKVSQNTSRGVTVNVWAQRELIERTAEARGIAVKFLNYFEEYFDMNFALPKLDIIALPDFSHSAMENWGLITGKENVILYDPEKDSHKQKQKVRIITGHEVAHQWFGNLVTMEWWNDLWLNEGFANYMGYFATEAVDKTEKMMDVFVLDNTISALTIDSQKNTHPVRIIVYDPVQVIQAFDVITYRKGSALIEMMSNFLGNATFRTGLQIYMKAHQYANAVSDDLWAAFDKAVNRSSYAANRMGAYSVQKVMNNWVTISGYPLVTVIRNYDTGIAEISQNRFSEAEEDVSDDESWFIPFTYLEKGGNWYENVTLEWLSDKKIVLRQKIFKPHDWMVGNVLLKGFYRVNYDVTNWNLLTNQLTDDHLQIAPIQRAQLIDDSFHLAKAGNLPLSISLNMTRYLEKEMSYLPWAVANSMFSTLDIIAQTTEHYGLFQKYVQNLLKRPFGDLGWNLSKDDKLRAYLQQILISRACYYGNTDCLVEIKRRFLLIADEIKNGDIIKSSTEMKSLIMCYGIEQGNVAEWELIWEYYLTLSNDVDKEMYLLPLACTRIPWLIKRLLTYSLDNNLVKPQVTPKLFMALSSNSAAKTIAWTFVKQNWNTVSAKLNEIAAGLAILTRSFCTQTELDDLNNFMNTNDLKWAIKTFDEVRESIYLNIKFREQSLDSLVSWLQWVTK